MAVRSRDPGRSQPDGFIITLNDYGVRGCADLEEIIITWVKTVLILGCGTIGTLVGNALHTSGWQVTGVRRSPSNADIPFHLLAGDLADAQFMTQLPSMVDAVLLCATPGLRRGRNHGLATAAQLAVARFSSARLVYTGSTAVYGDAAGGGVDERGPLAVEDPAVQGLLAIEEAWAKHPNALTLRVAALVGPTRNHALERVRMAAENHQPCVVKGDPDRPFSFIHDLDCADLCIRALLGDFNRGIINAAAPERLSVRAYYHELARRIGVSVTVVGDGTQMPARWINAARLWQMEPQRMWRRVEATG